jgi:hypothetical protein
MTADLGTVTVTVGPDFVFVDPHPASVAAVAAPATPNHARRESALFTASIRATRVIDRNCTFLGHVQIFAGIRARKFAVKLTGTPGASFHPALSSLLNLVERWCRELTDKALPCGVFHSVPDLNAYLEPDEAAPVPPWLVRVQTAFREP